MSTSRRGSPIPASGIVVGVGPAGLLTSAGALSPNVDACSGGTRAAPDVGAGAGGSAAGGGTAAAVAFQTTGTSAHGSNEPLSCLCVRGAERQEAARRAVPTVTRSQKRHDHWRHQTHSQERQSPFRHIAVSPDGKRKREKRDARRRGRPGGRRGGRSRGRPGTSSPPQPPTSAPGRSGSPPSTARPDLHNEREQEGGREERKEGGGREKTRDSGREGGRERERERERESDGVMCVLLWLCE
eukprot:3107663-Rhodomonas_salina.1